ncbi:MAG: S1C family serine protease, partial [Acutalibacteraceae bacterium]
EVQSGSASSAGGQTVNITTSDSATTAEAVAAKCSSSIVGIRVTTESTYWSWYGTQTGESYGEGTGVIYSSDGYIITNYHVISSAVTSSNARLEVFFGDDTENGIPATLVGYVVSADIAVIKIDKTGLTPIEIGDSDTLVLGQKVLAIGNPGGIKYIGSISEGIISGLNRQISIENIGEMTVIQTDAAINPGNSGGALVNSSGKLIGVVSSKIVSESYEGIGFAIPSNTAVSIAKEIIENPESRKPYVGVTISASYDSETLNKMGYPSGVVVESVTDDGPAATAGIQRGDIITAVGDTKITSYDEFSAAINNYRPGVTITLTVYRSGRNYQASVTLGETN